MIINTGCVVVWILGVVDTHSCARILQIACDFIYRSNVSIISKQEGIYAQSCPIEMDYICEQCRNGSPVALEH